MRKVFDCKVCNARLLNAISLMTTGKIELGDLWIALLQDAIKDDAETIVGVQYYPCPEIREEPGELRRRQKESADGVVAQLVINALIARVD